MRTEPDALERTFAMAVVLIAKAIAEQAKRLSAVEKLGPADIRALADLSQAVGSLNRGALSHARRILERHG